MSKKKRKRGRPTDRTKEEQRRIREEQLIEYNRRRREKYREDQEYRQYYIEKDRRRYSKERKRRSSQVLQKYHAKRVCSTGKFPVSAVKSILGIDRRLLYRLEKKGVVSFLRSESNKICFTSKQLMVLTAAVTASTFTIHGQLKIDNRVLTELLRKHWPHEEDSKCQE